MLRPAYEVRTMRYVPGLQADGKTPASLSLRQVPVTSKEVKTPQEDGTITTTVVTNDPWKVVSNGTLVSIGKGGKRRTIDATYKTLTEAEMLAWRTEAGTAWAALKPADRDALVAAALPDATAYEKPDGGKMVHVSKEDAAVRDAKLAFYQRHLDSAGFVTGEPESASDQSALAVLFDL